MRKKLFVLVALLTSIAFADVVVRDSKVKAETPNYEMNTSAAVLSDALSGNVLARGFTENQFIAHLKDESGFAFPHPFVAMVGNAFANHYAIEISPDDVWLMILDGIRLHVKSNRDLLKNKFVQDGADTVINVQDNSLTMNSPSEQWMKDIDSIYDSLYKKLPKGTRESFSVIFSTSTNVDRFVSKTMVMAVSSEYYSYNLTTLCGIPKIVIKGQQSDWINLKKHFNMIAKELDMPWWAEQVNPILDEFVNAFNKKFNMEFWRGIYKYVDARGSGAVPGINGWINRFFPYLDKPKSSFLGMERSLERRSSWTEPLKFEEFPIGRSMVSMTWNNRGTKEKLKLHTGFWGVYLDPKTKILRTIRGYALVHP